MKANKVSLLILMAALTGCGGGSTGSGSPTTDMPMGVTYVSGSIGGDNQSEQSGETGETGGQSQSQEETNPQGQEEEEIVLNKVVGSMDDYLNDVYEYNGENMTGTIYKDSGMVSQHSMSTGSNDYKHDGDVLSLINDNIGNYLYVYNVGKYYTGRKATRNPDGSYTAILVESIREYDSIGSYYYSPVQPNEENGGKVSAAKVILGGEFEKMNEENRNDDHPDYLIMQLGEVDANGNFTSTSNDFTIASLNAKKAGSNMGWWGGYFLPDQFFIEDIPGEWKIIGNVQENDLTEPATDNLNPIEFTGKTNAVKISQTPGVLNEDLTGSAKLVVDFNDKQATYAKDLGYTLTLDFDGWKQIDINKNRNGDNSIKVDGQEIQNSVANTKIAFSRSGSHQNEVMKWDGDNVNEFNRAAGIYSVTNIDDTNGKVDVIGGFDANTNTPLSIGDLNQ